MQAQCERPLQQQGQINECHKKQADDEKLKATINEVDSDARKLSQPVQVWMKVKPNLSHQRSQMYAKKIINTLLLQENGFLLTLV